MPETESPIESMTALALSLIPGMGPASYHRLLEVFGSPERVFAAGREELSAAAPRLPAEALGAIRGGLEAGIFPGKLLAVAVAGPDGREGWERRERQGGRPAWPGYFHAGMSPRDLARVQVEGCRALGLQLVSHRDAGYPRPLLDLPHPPPFLWMRGEWLPQDGHAVSVVGTRYPTGYGVRACRELSLGIAECGLTVVSGLAVGIDTLAHTGALAVGGRTVAVLGSALDRLYPRENEALAGRIAQRGCVISEFPLGTDPHRTHFPRRNRLIAALSLGTLVVEAGTDSGALITSGFALDQGKEIFAVPGPIHSPGSRGTHKLIQEGAHLVDSHLDVLAVLQGLPQAVPARRFVANPIPVEAAAEAETAVVGVAEAETVAAALVCVPETTQENPTTLLDLVGSKPQPLDSIADRARRSPLFQGIPSHRLLAGLLDLELKGKILRLPGSQFRLA